MSHFSDHTKLILSEELNIEDGNNDNKEGEEVSIIQEENVTYRNQFSPVDTNNKPGLRTFPIYGEGKLDTLAIRAKSPDYEVYVSVDKTDVINNKSFIELDEISTDLSRISAYQSAQGEYVITLNGYPFREILRVEVLPNIEMEFTLVRAELFMKDIQNSKAELK